MLWLGLGAAAVLLSALLLRVFAGASVGQVRAGLAWLAGLGVVAVAALLVLSGRAGQVAWLGVLFGPVLWRWWQGRRVAARFGAAPAGGAGDSVRTAALEMRLDAAAGVWTGTVRRGPFAGRDLGGLAPDEALALLRAVETDDPESVPLLEAWLDRAHPGWRDAAGWRGTAGGPGAGRRAAGSGRMPRAEALAVLGLAEGAGAEVVRAAYTRLMRAAHPDAGGSDWLAARLNEARDALLDE